jgi:hypothetical protein
VQTVTARTKGHGRLETRTLATTTCLNDYLDWPQLGQVFRLTRERRVNGVATVEVTYGITSLGRPRAGAGRLLDLTRAHWGIENGLHYTRDETLGEDRCRVRRGRAPQVLASLRNVAVHLLRGQPTPSLAAATRRFAAEPTQALDLLHHRASISA